MDGAVPADFVHSLSCSKRIELLTLWFSLFGLFSVEVPKGEPFIYRSFGQVSSRKTADSWWGVPVPKLGRPHARFFFFAEAWKGKGKGKARLHRGKGGKGERGWAEDSFRCFWVAKTVLFFSLDF